LKNMEDDNLNRLISVILTCFLCSNCIGCSASRCNSDLFNEISLKTANEIEKEYPNLRLTGLGGSSEEDIVKIKQLVFRVNGKLNRDQGIILIHKIVTRYLNNVQNDKYLKKYFSEHHFNYDNLIIYLIIYNENGEEVYRPDLAYVDLTDGIILFQTLLISENGASHIETVEKIPYEEAIKDL